MVDNIIFLSSFTTSVDSSFVKSWKPMNLFVLADFILIGTRTSLIDNGEDEGFFTRKAFDSKNNARRIIQRRLFCIVMIACDNDEVRNTITYSRNAEDAFLFFFFH